MAKKIETRISNKHDFEINWVQAKGFVPLDGELIIYDKETDENGNILITKKGQDIVPVVPLPEENGGRTTPIQFFRIKIGDGRNTVNDLPFFGEQYNDINKIPDNIKDGEGKGALEQLHDSETWTGIDAEGNEVDYETKASGKFSTIYGGESYAEGGRSLAGGTKSIAKGSGSLAFGDTNYAGDYATAFGYQTRALGAYSHTEGRLTVTEESNAHAEGGNTQALGVNSHAEGGYTTASNDHSHAEGFNTVASGQGSHAEGFCTTASGESSHAEGWESVASGNIAHTEGLSTTASGESSHAEGYSTTASGYYSHAEGDHTTASGYYSHSEGQQTKAIGDNSHAGGRGTIAAGEAQTAIGRYNKENSDALFIIGNGDDNENRKNAFVINSNGSIGGEAEKFLVGKTIEDGGEIFNDYKNNKAISEFSSAKGYNAIAGCYGFKILEYNSTFLTNDSSVTKTFSNGAGISEDNINTLTEGTLVEGQEYTWSFYCAEYLGWLVNDMNTPPTTDIQTTITSIAEQITVNGNTYTGFKAETDYWPFWETPDARAYTVCVYQDGTEIKVYRSDPYTGDIINLSNDFILSIKNTAGIEIGDKLSLYIAPREGNESHPFGNYDLYTTVNSISGNNIILSKSLPDSYEFTPNSGDYIWFPYKPTLNGDITIGTGASAEGYETKATTTCSHTEGYNTIALGKYAHAEGNSTIAGYASHSEGIDTQAIARQSHAEGKATKALKDDSHAEGNSSIADGYHSHAEGLKTKTEGTAAHSEGSKTQALAEASHSEGKNTIANGIATHAEGESTKNYAKASHTEGFNTKVGKFNNDTLITETTETSLGTHAEGFYTQAQENGAHAEGEHSKAYGRGTHSEGMNTKAQSLEYESGEIGGTHAEGYYTEAIGVGTHSEGYETKSSGRGAHAEGRETIAQGQSAHAEGHKTTARGYNSHAEGSETIAHGMNSHSSGKGTQALVDNQTVVGTYNVRNYNSTALFVVGNGTSDNNRKDAFVVHKNGTATIQVSGTNDNNVVNYKQLKDYVAANAKSPWDSQNEMLFSTGDLRIENHILNDSKSEGSISIGVDSALTTGFTYTRIDSSAIHMTEVHSSKISVLSSQGLTLSYHNGVWLDLPLESSEEIKQRFNEQNPSIQIQGYGRIYNNEIPVATNLGIMGVTHKGKFISWDRIFNAVERIENM